MNAIVRSRARLVGFALAWALSGVTVGCQPPEAGAIIDGFAVGDRYECPERGEYDAAECRTYIPIATVALDRRDPGHAPIIAAALHEQLFPGEDGLPRLAVCSGGCMSVAVFRLMDGSVRAIAVGTPGIATEAMTVDYGSIDRSTTR